MNECSYYHKTKKLIRVLDYDDGRFEEFHYNESTWLRFNTDDYIKLSAIEFNDMLKFIELGLL